MSLQIKQWLQLGRVTVDRLLWSLSNCHHGAGARRPHSLLLIGLERRLLMSATPIDAAVLAANEVVASPSSDMPVAFQSDLGSTNDLQRDSIAETSVGATAGIAGGTTGDSLEQDSVIAIADQADPDSDAMPSDLGQNPSDADVVVPDSQHHGIITVTTIRDVNDTGSDTFDSATLFSDPGSDGEVSLTEAIIAANNTSGIDTIRFNLAGAGPHVIDLNSSLPQLLDSVVIAGTTQPGFVDRPNIFLNGNDLLTDGLVLDSGTDGSEIRGLGLINFGRNGIVVRSSTNTIAGNWIGGFDPTLGNYDASLRNGRSGVSVSGADNVIGGADDLDRNTIGGNDSFGVILDGPSATDNSVLNNWIGVTPDAMDDAPLGLDGIGIFDSAQENLISGNVVGNAQHGIHLYSASENVFINNAIGTNHSQTRTIGNASAGIRIAGNSDNNKIGRLGKGNVIAGNSFGGVTVLDSSTGNSIRFNQITGNRQLPIDLDGDGIDTNDSLDLDTGGNDRQNRPTLNNATLSASGLLSVDLELHAEASRNYRIDLYEASADAGSVGDPVRYLGFSVVTTTATGTVNLTVQETTPWATGGELVVATATDDDGNTSEFSSYATVNHDNRGPRIGDVETTSLSYVENSGPKFVTSSVTVFGGNSQSLVSATVSVLDYEVDQDRLGLLDQTNISGSWDPVMGILSLSGRASASEYQSALRSVTYQNTSENPSVESRTISIVVFDGAQSSAVANRVINPVRKDDPTSGIPVLPMVVAEGQTITVDTESIEDLDGMEPFRFQWFSDGVAINGATEEVFVPGIQQIDKKLTVTVSFTDGMGNDLALTSAPTGYVLNTDAPATGRPVIVGIPIEDETLSVLTTGIADPDGLSAPNYSYQWLRNGSIIGGATSTTYTLQDADVGATLSVEVAFIDDLGTSTSFESSSVGRIVNVNDVPLGLPVIEGSFVDQQTLSTRLDGISDADGIPSTTDFQWLRDGDEINEAEDQTYTLTNDDVGHLISVRITYVDLHGTIETIVSQSSPPISILNDAPTLKDWTQRSTFGKTLNQGTTLFERAANDIDGDPLTAVLVSGPTRGTLDLQSDGSFRYMPEAEFYGTVSFTWQAFDGLLSSNVATVRIVIAPLINTPGDSTESNDESGGRPTDRGSSDKNDSSDDLVDDRPESGTVLIIPDTGTPSTGGGAMPTEVGGTTDWSEDVIGHESRMRLIPFRTTPDEDGSRSNDRGTLNDRFRHLASIHAADQNARLEVVQPSVSETIRPVEWADYELLGAAGEMWEELDHNQHRLNRLLDGNQWIVGSFGAATGGFTVAALAWLRSGFMVLGLWQQRPIWSRMDPLMLMQGLRPKDDESLADVIADQRKKLELDIDPDETE